MSSTLTFLIFLMILSGGLVAGTRAGIPFPTWPLMGDTFIPPQIYSMTPSWLSAFEDMATIQFNHRIFAYLLTIFIIVFSIFLFTSNAPRFLKRSAIVLIVCLALQVILGISTLLLYIPIPIAAGHQVGAVALLSVSLFITHSCLSKKQI